MGNLSELLLVAIGLIAGSIDSIAGGGGLITVPVLSLIVGPGALAIGTNKIAAVASTLSALLIYLKNGHVSLRGNRTFAMASGIGAILGAHLSPRVPPETYRIALILILPVMLWVVFRKDLWIRNEVAHESHKWPHRLRWRFWALGFACGFYDGIAGPGGGTLMFISLFLVARIPLLSAMATAKVANLASASLSLATFVGSGHVAWSFGLWIGLGMVIGAAVGASLANRRAASVARFALLILAGVLTVRLALS